MLKGVLEEKNDKIIEMTENKTSKAKAIDKMRKLQASQKCDRGNELWPHESRNFPTAS